MPSLQASLPSGREAFSFLPSHLRNLSHCSSRRNRRRKAIAIPKILSFYPACELQDVGRGRRLETVSKHGNLSQTVARISQDLPGLTVGADLRVRPNEGRRIGLPLLGWSVVADFGAFENFETLSLCRSIIAISCINIQDVPARRSTPTNTLFLNQTLVLPLTITVLKSFRVLCRHSAKAKVVSWVPLTR